MPSPSRAALRTETDEPRRGPGARFRGRWRIALRYGARDARRNKGRTALVAVMVALPVMLGSFAATVLWSTQGTPERRVAQELGPSLQASITFANMADLQQSPDGNAASGNEQLEGPVTVADLDAALDAALPAGARVTHAVAAPVIVFGESLQSAESGVQADLSDAAVAAAFPVTEGTLPGPGEVAVSRRVADELHLAIGDDVSTRLGGSAGSATELVSATISGVLATNQPVSASVLYPATGPLTTADDLTTTLWDGAQPLWFVSGDAPVTWDDVLELNESSLQVTSRDVLLSPPHHSAVPMYAGVPQTSASDFLATWGLLGAVVAIALLEAVLLIGPVFAVGARRSARSLAIIAANGGTSRSLRAVVLGTGVVIGALASLGGVVLGLTGAAALVAQTDGLRFFSPPWLIVAGIALVGVLLAAAAAWLPARGASKADVVAVLAGRRGEVSARRWPAIVGTVAAVAGFTAAVVGGITTQPLLLLAGVIVGELGLVLACGGIVSGLGRLAGRLPLTWRFALRDASRHRSRTTPAIAAVLIATAGATAGIVFSTAQAEYDYRSQYRVAADGILVLADYLTGSPDVDALTDADVATIRRITADVVPGADLVPVTRLVPPAEGDDSYTTVYLRMESSPSGGVSGGAIWGPIVDDGSLVDVLGILDPDTARAALAAGRVVVLAGGLGPDDTATLAIETWAADADATSTPLSSETVPLPATAVGDARGPSNTVLPVVPPSALSTFTDAGMTTEVGGLVSAQPVELTAAERQTLETRLADAFGATEWGEGRIGVGIGEPAVDYGSPDWLATLIIAGSGALLALAAAWIATALAATESRPDLATLTAVGAVPSTRKRIVAAQAGTVAGIGAFVGVLSGYPLGAAFVLFFRYRWTTPDLAWSLTFPWPWLLALLVGLPLLAVTAAWLATRSRLVLTRRIAG
ncbi:FtsX-like permease family protein [Xylanimonas cellulosilytica]|uniref:FtsX-like permease family protein n=1 Tax=Xylanimonas cellulosilytica TaxID=186189 RepID=UPI0016511742|nr:FtsX-like permease family protein [Xylanimonas cellulosilytica]